jgi:type II secretory pathway pseudopilin PulG
MRLPIPNRRRRRAMILVLAALLLPVLIGMVGLVIDSGLLMATHRQARNAADGAAVAAAWDLLRGRSIGTATSTANTFVHTYHGLGAAVVTVNVPPSSGPYAGSTKHAEVLVSQPMNTLFIQALGVARNRTVQSRAVAGYEAVSAGEGAIVLDQEARPGLSIQGGGHLVVNGRVVVNSRAAGYDENNSWVNNGLQQYAVATGNGSTVQATDLQVVGGVDVTGNIQPAPGSSGNILHARALPEPDPLKELPTPTASMAGVNTTDRGSVRLSGGTTTLQPGIYSSIRISNNANVTFQPGIYILKPPSSGGGTVFSINGGGAIRGDGVMFYVTGSNFNVNTGLPDSGDGETRPPLSDGANFQSVNVNGSDVRLTGLANATSPFNGMLFYFRRGLYISSGNTAGIQGSGSANQLNGTIYSKWGNFTLSGSGSYGAQFIVGSMSISGQANVTLTYAGQNLGRANRVYLVE